MLIRQWESFLENNAHIHGICCNSVNLYNLVLNLLFIAQMLNEYNIQIKLYRISGLSWNIIQSLTYIVCNKIVVNNNLITS